MVSKALKIGYFRVSKEDETLQDLDIQIEKVKEKFSLSDDISIYKERGSAYKLDKLKNRTELLKLIDLFFDANNLTIRDLFLQKYTEKEIEFYVWDYSRIIRSMEFGLLFSILSCLCTIKIYSYKDGLISNHISETPSSKLGKYMMTAIYSYSGEEYSYNISTNVKKVIVDDKGVTLSSKGNKWGSKFKDLEGKRIDIEPNRIRSMNYYILKYINDDMSYSDIISKIGKKFKVAISKAYISVLKGKNGKNK